MENDEFQNIHIKNHACYYFDFDNFEIHNSLLTEKTLTLYNVIVNVKSVLKEDQNHYYYNIFLEKYSNQLAKKQ